MVTTAILLIYATGALITFVWMNETWDAVDLLDPESQWLPLMWPALLYLVVTEWIKR